MKSNIPLPLSVNNPTPYELAVEIPPGKYYRVDVVVSLPRGDVDNRIKPVLKALKKNGLKLNRVVHITCRFGSVSSVRIRSVDF